MLTSRPPLHNSKSGTSIRNLQPLPSEMANPRFDNRMKNRNSMVPENFKASLYMN